MRNWFETIFGRPFPRPAAKPRLTVERLDARIVPCGGASGSGAGASAAGQFAFANGGGFGFGGFFGHGDFRAAQATFAASLSDSSGATGEATFSDDHGVLTVSVKGATASTTLTVTVTDNGTTTTLGTLTTNASGDGHARFKNATVAAGDTISVGDLTGAFAQVHFTASLTGSTTGVSGTAAFNSVQNELAVSVKGATAKTTYTVTVNGTSVGELTTNSHGRGFLYVTPPTGVTITSGSTVSVAPTAGGSAILTGSFS